MYVSMYLFIYIYKYIYRIVFTYNTLLLIRPFVFDRLCPLPFRSRWHCHQISGFLLLNDQSFHAGWMGWIWGPKRWTLHLLVQKLTVLDHQLPQGDSFFRSLPMGLLLLKCQITLWSNPPVACFRPCLVRASSSLLATCQWPLDLWYPGWPWTWSWLFSGGLVPEVVH